MLTEQARQARNAYSRAYYQTHKVERKAAQERYWARRAERMEQEKQQRREKAREASAREQD